MQYPSHVPKVHIRLDNLRHNYRVLNRVAVDFAMKRAMAGGQAESADNGLWPDILPVVKADAYGHGHIRVAKALSAEGVQAFASGSVQEGVELRRGLREINAFQPHILALLGLVYPSDISLASEYGICPVVHSFWQLELLSKAGIPLNIAVKFNSGMARLGFEEPEVSRVTALLKRMPWVRPMLAVSHLASADTEEGVLEVRRQGQKFARMFGALRKEFPLLTPSLANSAGMLLGEELSELLGKHTMRPGLTLYGSNPLAQTSLSHLGQELLPVMSVSTPVLALRELAPGEAIGYGHTFRAIQSTQVAIIAAGYADAFSRGLSNKGEICIRNKRARILGRVSMQMTAVDVTGIEGVSPGDDAWLLGGPFTHAVSADELAQTWGTIPYEVFCLLGVNTHMYYEGEAE